MKRDLFADTVLNSPSDSLPQWNDWKKHLPSKACPSRSTLKIQGNNRALPFLKFFLYKAVPKGRAARFPQTLKGGDTAWHSHSQGAAPHSLSTIHPGAAPPHRHHLPHGSAPAPRDKTGGPSCGASARNKNRTAGGIACFKRKINLTILMVLILHVKLAFILY